MASKHRQVGAQNVRLEETNRSMYITIVSVMVSKKLCLFERSEDFFRKLSNFMASEIVLKVSQPRAAHDATRNHSSCSDFKPLRLARTYIQTDKQTDNALYMYR